MTFLQNRDIYDSSVGDVIEASVESFLQTEFNDAYRSFYALELHDIPADTEFEGSDLDVRITVSFAGSFIFVLSGVMPSSNEIHCLQMKVLLDSYAVEYEDFVGFNETGIVELDYINFGANTISCTEIDDDDTIIDATGEQDDENTDNSKMNETAEPRTQVSSSRPKAKSISVKEFVLSREFMFLVLATVLMPMLICLGCVCRQSKKVWWKQKASKDKRESSSTRKTAGMTSSHFLEPSLSNSNESV